MKQEEKQEKIVELKALDQEIKKIQKQIETVDQQITEMQIIGNTLDEFSKLKAGAKLKVPLAHGIFIDAVLKNNKDLLVNVGANVSVKKNVPKVKEMLENQVKELNKFRMNLIDNLQKMVVRVQEIQKEFE
jgi:prefoldin alpha subunit